MCTKWTISFSYLKVCSFMFVFFVLKNTVGVLVISKITRTGHIYTISPILSVSVFFFLDLEKL